MTFVLLKGIPMKRTFVSVCGLKKLEQRICKEFTKRRRLYVRDVVRKLITSIAALQRTNEKYNISKTEPKYLKT